MDPEGKVPVSSIMQGWLSKGNRGNAYRSRSHMYYTYTRRVQPRGSAGLRQKMDYKEEQVLDACASRKEKSADLPLSMLLI